MQGPNANVVVSQRNIGFRVTDAVADQIPPTHVEL